MGQKFIIMKKTLLIISLVAMISMSGNAQSKDVRFGVKFGPTFDWASSGSTAAKSDGMRVGFNVGLVYDHYLTRYFAISSGVNANFLRMKYTFTDYRRVEDFLEEADVTVSRRLKATNFEVPLKVKLGFDIMDSFRAYVEAGGGVSFNAKDLCKDSYSFYWVNYDSQTYEDRTNQYRPLQLSMIFGVGAEYEINRTLSAFAQLTFDHGFSNVFVKSLEKQTSSILRNNFVGVEVGVLF